VGLRADLDEVTEEKKYLPGVDATSLNPHAATVQTERYFKVWSEDSGMLSRVVWLKFNRLFRGSSCLCRRGIALIRGSKDLRNIDQFVPDATSQKTVFFKVPSF
jgi:hypothetical protein